MKNQTIYKKIFSSITLTIIIVIGMVLPLETSATSNNSDQDDEKVTVAIYPFTSSRSFSYEYATSVGNAIEAGFVRSGRFIVVERSRFKVLSEEDRFKEAQTSEMVEQATRLGAKVVVTGHVIGASTGQMLDINKKPNGKQYMELSVSFKIIDAKTGTIEMSETIIGKGVESTSTAATQAAYTEIDRLARAYVATYLPQRFAFMAVDGVKERKKDSYLETFKIWGGSDNGLKVGDILQIYLVSSLTNPNTKEVIEEKKFLAEASISEINSGSTATCSVVSPAKLGQSLLDLVNNSPEKVAIEYQGTLSGKGRSLQDLLFNN